MQKLKVIKIGGHVIDNESFLDRFLTDLSQINYPFILVHGGGKLATQLANKLNIPQQMVDGRRITDAETLKIATMVYAGFINKKIVSILQKNNRNVIGLSGADGNVIKAKKRLPNPIDFGYVGDLNIENINTDFIQKLIELDVYPVICAIMHDGNGQLLNTNADTVANYVAISLSKIFEVELMYCFEEKGVLKDPKNNQSIIYQLDKKLYSIYKDQNIITGGMIPKLDNCFYAIDHGVSEVSIIQASNLSPFIKNQSNDGTRIKHTL